MYELADAIIGPLKTIDDTTRSVQDDALSQITNISVGTTGRIDNEDDARMSSEEEEPDDID